MSITRRTKLILVIVAACLQFSSALSADAVSYNGCAYTPVEGAKVTVSGPELVVSDGGATGTTAPTVPYELSFDARMPKPTAGAPDFGVGQVWFSVDYGGEFDRLAFAIRGGNIQSVIVLSYAQNQPPSPSRGSLWSSTHAALNNSFRRLAKEIKPGQWFHVRVIIAGESVSVEIDGRPAAYYQRKMIPGRSFCLGGSWQENRFRNISLRHLDKSAVPSESSISPVRNSNRQAADRKNYKPTLLPEIRGSATLNVSLDGKWLLKPVQEKPSDPVNPVSQDMDWHVVSVPSFWNVTGWWIFGQGLREVSQSYLTEELNRCEKQTFDWRKTRSAYYRKWLNVPGDWAGRRVCVTFNAVASACVVYCNGNEVGRNLGMFKHFTVDISKYIKPGQKNLLALWVNNGISDDSAASKDTGIVAVTMPITSDMLSGIPKGMFSTPAEDDGKPMPERQGGIWQSVTLHVSRDIRISDVWSQVGLDKLSLDISANGAGVNFNGASARIKVMGKSGRALISSTVPWKPNKVTLNEQTMSVSFQKLKPKLWSPNNPNLYRLTVDIVRGNQVMDSQSFNIGFRTFETKGDKFYLNGKPFRWLGADTPPHGLRPNDRQLAHSFTSFMKKSNCNATRGHASPYTEVWLDEADKQGLSVSIEGTWPWLMIRDTAIPSDTNLRVWKDEWYDLIRQLGKHPSVVIWTINNETHFLSDSNVERRIQKWDILENVVSDMRKLDPSRPISIWSGYHRHQNEASFDEMNKTSHIGNDDGDIDDYHIYAGTYTPSMLRDKSSAADAVNSVMIPGRPFLSQESATAYTDTDTGHPERSYVRSWHSQIWVGNDAYEHRNPIPYLKRQARITGEQLEAVRQTSVAGWLAFCSSTWYHNVQDAATISPYPVVESVCRALSPVLVGLNMPVRQFLAGARIEPEVFVVNDDLNAADLKKLSVVVKVESESGKTLAQSVSEFPDVPILQTKHISVPITMPGKLERAHNTLYLVLELQNSAGARLASNRYELTVCTSEYLKCNGPVIVSVADGNVDLNIISILKQAGVLVKQADSSSNSLLITSGISGSSWDSVTKYAESGGCALVFNPSDLSGLKLPEKTEIKDVPSDGECANVTNDRTSPLLNDMQNCDLAWWLNLSGGPRVYNKAIVFDGDLPSSVQVLVDHIPPHGYDNNWHAEFPVIRISVGRGSVILCTLNFSGVENDPLAARFLCNLVSYAATM